MKCSYCGEENAEGEKYCSNCGMKLEEHEPAPARVLVRCENCGFMNPAGVSECQGCGEPMELVPEKKGVCPHCGFDRNPETAKFCMNCGNKLAPEEPAPVSAPIPEPEPVQFARLVLPNSREVALSEPEEYIGRADFLQELSPEEAKYISREHLKILYEDGKYYILDEKSTNGTKLNGSDITGQGKKELKDNDTIVLADTVTATFRAQ